MKTSILRIIILLTVYLSISACGNKGDLYLPDERTKGHQPKPTDV
ncbi:MAG: lipoprotein, partial [Proteobacteria bacterium]|nr:lipoprotein [Pseudomonadota bacterium]